MRILTTLTYYAPHISGLTTYARRLVRGLVADGHQVSVLTSRYDRSLPAEEVVDGAAIHRSPVALRVSKGTLMPRFALDMGSLIRSHDIVHVHLPQFEASLAAVAARIAGRPVVATYHCDIEMPRGISRLAFTPVIRASHYLAGRMADRVVVNSQSYADASRLGRHFHQKVLPVYPPIELAHSVTTDAESVARLIGTRARPVIGFVGRLAEEKGIEHMIDAIPLVQRAYPDAQFILAGLTEQVPGEDVYQRLVPRMHAMSSAVRHIGVLTDGELRAFYETIDVLALPSVNSTESFGMTQAEAMLAGTPVVSTDLPGVREPIEITGMGRTVPPADPAALAEGLISVLGNPAGFRQGHDRALSAFGVRQTVAFYEGLFQTLLASPGKIAPPADVASNSATAEYDAADDRRL
jgi:glycosyltransferase involved in cell wall biosynthesis